MALPMKQATQKSFITMSTSHGQGTKPGTIVTPATWPATEITPLFIGSEDERSQSSPSIGSKKALYITLIVFSLIVVFVLYQIPSFNSRVLKIIHGESSNQLDGMGFDHSDTLMKPFSYSNPTDHDFYPIDRAWDSMPGEVLSNVGAQHKTLPTNAWCENFFLGSGTTENNHVYQIPYVVDTIGPSPGIRTHPVRAQASNREVIVSTSSNYNLKYISTVIYICFLSDDH
jgi:hypothetical protein